MFHKSHKTEEIVFEFQSGKQLAVTMEETNADDTHDLLLHNHDTLEDALGSLNLLHLPVQIFIAPTNFHPSVVELFDKYKDLTLKEIIDQPFMNCFHYMVEINPLKLEAGITLRVLSDGVNDFHWNQSYQFVKGGIEQQYSWTTVENQPGIHIQEFLRGALTGPDYQVFKDLKRTLEKFKTADVKPMFYILEFPDTITATKLEMFHKRCSNQLGRMFEILKTKATPEVHALLEARTLLGFPKPNVGLKVYRGAKDVTSVAFYLD